jgi:hypothetical protein
MNLLESKDFYFCYSPNQYRHIKASGLRFICTGLSENTGRQFWMYEKHVGLDNVLKQYAANKPVIGGATVND